MSAGSANAFPINPRENGECWAAGTEGLSKRELFAAMAMQGLSASNAYAESPVSQIASMAVEQADALLAKLEMSE